MVCKNFLTNLLPKLYVRPQDYVCSTNHRTTADFRKWGSKSANPSVHAHTNYRLVFFGYVLRLLIPKKPLWTTVALDPSDTVKHVADDTITHLYMLLQVFRVWLCVLHIAHVAIHVMSWQTNHIIYVWPIPIFMAIKWHSHAKTTVG